MSTLTGTTWTFSTQGTLAGTITFQSSASPHSGMATINATGFPPGTKITSFQAYWAEYNDGSHFAVQFEDFSVQDGLNPPPLGISEIITSEGCMSQPVILFGTHSNGLATMFGTNFQSQCPNGHVVGNFTMTKQP